MLQLAKPDGTVVHGLKLPLQLRNGAVLDRDQPERPCVDCGSPVRVLPTRAEAGTPYCPPCFDRYRAAVRSGEVLLGVTR